jgi:hypothetical protein
VLDDGRRKAMAGIRDLDHPRRYRTLAPITNDLTCQSDSVFIAAWIWLVLGVDVITTDRPDWFGR